MKALERCRELLPAVLEGRLEARAALQEALPLLREEDAAEFVRLVPIELRGELLEITDPELPTPEGCDAAVALVEASILQQFGVTEVMAPSRREKARKTWARDRAEANERWGGQPRPCPRCQHVFTSVQDKGICPSCGHEFFASEPE